MEGFVFYALLISVALFVLALMLWAFLWGVKNILEALIGTGRAIARLFPYLARFARARPILTPFLLFLGLRAAGW